MADVLATPTAAAAHRALRADLTRADLAEAVAEVLLQLRDDPGAADLRRRAFNTIAAPRTVFAVRARGRNDDWWVLWHPTETGDVVVVYIGEAPSA